MLNQVQHDTIFHVKYIPLLLVRIKILYALRVSVANVFDSVIRFSNDCGI